MDASCYLDQSTPRAVRYVPEKKVAMAKFDEQLWRRKFPTDIGSDRSMIGRSVNLRSLQLTNIGIYSIATPDIARELAAFAGDLARRYLGMSPEETTITETHGGMGGMTIRLAASGFKKINAVEVNPAHARIIKNNLAQYGLLDRVNVMAADYMDVMDSVHEDIIVCDPPWGGRDYSKKKAVRLAINNVLLPCIINQVFARKSTRAFIIMAPKNYDIANLLALLDHSVVGDVVVHSMGKHYLVGACRGGMLPP